jgi:hypothetical protein
MHCATLPMLWYLSSESTIPDDQASGFNYMDVACNEFDNEEGARKKD